MSFAHGSHIPRLETLIYFHLKIEEMIKYKEATQTVLSSFCGVKTSRRFHSAFVQIVLFDSLISNTLFLLELL